MTIANFPLQCNKKFPSISRGKAAQLIATTFDAIKKNLQKRDIDQLAWETGFVQRSSAKIRGFDFLTSLLIASLDPAHASLEKISEIFTRINRSVKITAQAVMEKINSENSVEFLHSIFKDLLNKKSINITEKENSTLPLSFFSKVLIEDSSVIQLNEKLSEHFKGSGGRASSSFAKLDVIFDYKSKEFERIKLTDQGEADQKLALEIEGLLTKNTLVIRDLGYLRMDSLQQIISKEAYFLSRLKLNLNVYLSKDDTQEVDLVKYIENHGTGNGIDLQIYLTEQKLPMRLVAFKAPEAVVNERRRVARATAKKQGRTLTQKTLNLMSLTIFITNVPAEVWRADIIPTIYKLRWQIELIFKCWKSRLHISYLKGINPFRIRCLIYSRLILILISNEIYKLTEFISKDLLGREVSMPKVFEWIRDSRRLICIIKGHLPKCEVNLFIYTISKSMCMQKRKRKTTFRSVSEYEFSY